MHHPATTCKAAFLSFSYCCLPFSFSCHFCHFTWYFFLNDRATLVSFFNQILSLTPHTGWQHLHETTVHRHFWHGSFLTCDTAGARAGQQWLPSTAADHITTWHKWVNTLRHYLVSHLCWNIFTCLFLWMQLILIILCIARSDKTPKNCEKCLHDRKPVSWCH